MKFSKIVRYVIFVLLVALVLYFYKQIAKFLSGLFKRKAPIVQMNTGQQNNSPAHSQQGIVNSGFSAVDTNEERPTNI